MRRVLQRKGQCGGETAREMRRGKCREMRWECAREAPALGTTFHSLAWEGAGEFFLLFFHQKLWLRFLNDAASLCFLMYFLKKGRNYGGLRYLE